MTALKKSQNHEYGNHTNCKEWCNFSEDPESYKHKLLPLVKDLKGEDLGKALKELFGAYSGNSQKLRKLGSTQSNESFNASVASFAAKSRHYSASESVDFRISTAVCKKNLGPKYSLHVLTPTISDLCTAQQMKLAVKLSTLDYLSFKSMNNLGDFPDSPVL